MSLKTIGIITGSLFTYTFTLMSLMTQWHWWVTILIVIALVFLEYILIVLFLWGVYLLEKMETRANFEAYISGGLSKGDPDSPSYKRLAHNLEKDSLVNSKYQKTYQRLYKQANKK